MEQELFMNGTSFVLSDGTRIKNLRLDSYVATWDAVTDKPVLRIRATFAPPADGKTREVVEKEEIENRTKAIQEMFTA